MNYNFHYSHCVISETSFDYKQTNPKIIPFWNKIIEKNKCVLVMSMALLGYFRNSRLHATMQIMNEGNYWINDL